MKQGAIPSQSRYGNSPTIQVSKQFSTRMRKQIFTLFEGILAVALSASAQSLYPDTTGTRLKEVEVQATKSDSGLEATAPMHRLDAEHMLSTGVSGIADAVKRLPGVNLRDYGGSGGMKTVSVRGLGAQHSGILYDGAALSEIRGGQIDLSRFSLDNMASITLHIGDADDIFTPARGVAYASTLSITTLRSPDMLTKRPEFTASLRAASFGTINPYVRFAVSNGSNLGMSISGEFTHAKNNYKYELHNGDQTTHEKRQNSQLNLGHAEWNGIWQPTATSRLQAKIYWFDNSRHLPGPVVYYNTESNERLRERNIFGQLAFNARLGSKFSLKALAKYNWSATRYTDRNDIYPNGFRDQRYYQREEYASAILLYRPIEGLQASYAADFWHNSLSSNLKTDNHPMRNTLLQALSVKWKWWRLTAIARGLFSVIHDKSETAGGGKTEKRFSPSLSVSVHPLASAEWAVRASYKDIFRMPTFVELYFDHYGSVNLKPEKTRQLNVGSTFSHSFSSVLSNLEITLDGYLNQVSNKIVAMPYNMFVMTMTNLGKVRILGLDATLSANFNIADGQELLVCGNYSYQRAAPRTDRTQSDWMKQMAYTPLNSGAWSATWKNPWVHFVINSSGCSSRYPTSTNVQSTRIAGYMELGFSLFREFRLGNSKLLLRADMLNALNHQYEIIARYPMPGRSFSFTIKYDL